MATISRTFCSNASQISRRRSFIEPGRRSIGVELVQKLDLRGRAVLFATGWDRHFSTAAYGSGHPYLSEAAARWLADAEPTIVGIDSLNIDDTEDLRRPAHSILLGRNIVICEHMTNLAGLPDSGARFFAVPPKVRGMGSFPVRAFAMVD